MKKMQLEIINHYGLMNQLKYFQSEVFELNEAIIRLDQLYNVGIGENTEKRAKEHIAEEIADVEFMLGQFKEYFEIKDKQIEEIKIFKGKRQLDRIKNEN